MALKILFVVIKNSACMDYTVPLLRKINEIDKSAEISVLYSTLTREQILRKSNFYPELLEQLSIKQYDILDYLKKPYSVLKELIRKKFSTSQWDSNYSKKISKNAISKLGIKIVNLFDKSLEKIILKNIDYERILPSFNPDIVLLDNTASKTNINTCFLFDYLRENSKKVILLPHAPHHGRETAFHPYNSEDTLPDFCEVWIPFIHEKPWRMMPEQKSKFHYIGYPGLDSEWIVFIKKRNHVKKTSHNNKQDSKALKCLFVVRRFIEEGQKRTVKDNDFVYDYEEFKHYVDLLGEAIKGSKKDVKIIIKPHPSTDYLSLKRVFDNSEIDDWEISNEPIYALLNEIDFIVSLYSTVFFIPSISGIPVIVLNTSTQSLVNKWDKMKNLYTGFSHYLEKSEDIKEGFNDVIKSIEAKTSIDDSEDRIHLREFYPDGAIDRALDRLGL